MDSQMLSTAVKALKSHFFDVYTCKTGEEAAQLAMRLIPSDHTVSWGGSTTIDTIGLKDRLRQAGYRLIDRDTAKTPQERKELMRQGLLADTFLTSANAISLDGYLVNIDGNGNRVAAMCYGPSNVVVIAGINKLAPDLASAQDRARNVAAPQNAQRLQKPTPCASTGQCHDCLSPETICSYFLNTRISSPPGRIKVILVEEPLGY